MKKMISIVIGLIAVIILAFASNIFAEPNRSIQPKPVDGVLDLRNWSFEENGIVSIKGDWSFYFNKFLTHEDFQRGVDIQSVAVPVPSTQKSMEGVKPFPDNTFYGTLRMVILLPEKPAVYGLRSDLVLTSYKLYIDGILDEEVGKVGTSESETMPEYRNVYTYFSPKSNTIELIYHTSDFYARDCYIVAPKLGLADQISDLAQKGLGRDLFLFGVLLIMGIYHFGLFIMRRKDPAPLHFGIFCLLFALRLLLVGERFLPNNAHINFIIFARIAYLSVYLGVTALCGFLYYTLDGLFKKEFLLFSRATGLFAATVCFVIPYYWQDKLLIFYAVIALSLVVYSIVRLFVGVYKNYMYSGVVLFGFFCLGATFVNDLIYQITIANKASTIPLGVAIFTFTQAYTLSARFSNAFARAELLSDENVAITSELIHVNANLENIVKERTADLQGALEEMEVMSKTDYLTKLPNRRMMLQQINELVKEKRNFYVALVDIDHFKVINDTYGHLVGDDVLVTLSGVLIEALGDHGFVGRWGGEEFLLILNHSDEAFVMDKVNEIRLLVASCSYDEIPDKITITMGICRHELKNSLEVTIANADQVLYTGKRRGRNQCRLYREKD